MKRTHPVSPLLLPPLSQALSLSHLLFYSFNVRVRVCQYVRVCRLYVCVSASVCVIRSREMGGKSGRGAGHGGEVGGQRQW